MEGQHQAGRARGRCFLLALATCLDASLRLTATFSVHFTPPQENVQVPPPHAHTLQDGGVTVDDVHQGGDCVTGYRCYHMK